MDRKPLLGKEARKGVLITTSTFTADAREYVNQSIQQKMIDGETLANYMIDYNVGVTEVARYSGKKVELNFFRE